MEELIVTIQEGNIHVEVQGVKGGRCLEFTQAIESLLGKISSRKMKNDFAGEARAKQKIAVKIIPSPD